MLSKTEVIQRFLTGVNSDVQISGMEVQVLVEQGLGEKTKGGFSDGRETWYSFRLNSGEFSQSSLGYNFNKHVLCVGLSGWNYSSKLSLWVGFDFDSIIGHNSGLSEEELEQIVTKCKEVPWVTIRRSTGGKGLHFYVYLENSPEINSHKEHRKLAKFVLSKLSGLVNYNFESKIDCCGSILWIWHRKQHPLAFTTIKEATETFKGPFLGWNKTPEKNIEKLCGAIKVSELSEEHNLLLRWLESSGSTWWWDSDRHMLICHTFNLAQAHKALNLHGYFSTNSVGKNCPGDHNCFAFPMENGSWIVRRYGTESIESNYWKRDKSGYTYCYFNKIPALSDIASIYEGKLSSKGDWVFTSPSSVAELLGLISVEGKNISFPPWAMHRQITLAPLKNAQLAIKFDREKEDPDGTTWLRRKTWWEKVITVYEEEKPLKPPDELIRHVVSAGMDAGWFVFANEEWINEPKANVKDVLASRGYKPTEILDILGQCIVSPWRLINEPFGKEYPGNRQWNKFSPKLLFTPKEGTFDSWKKLIENIGLGLDESVKADGWCINNDIKTGYDYIVHWIAACFQEPKQPLPYLFLYGPQETGKSLFHETLSILTDHGVARAEASLTSQSRFNEELAGAILCITDEFNLNANKGAYERIKDWVTARTITIHPKFGKPFPLTNTTHWIQCANNPSFCPIQFGDTRIVMVYVERPKEPIPKSRFEVLLKEEAPAFLHHIFTLELPAPKDRLRIPVINTIEKEEQQVSGANPVEQFILDRMYYCPGFLVPFSEFCNRFTSWVTNSGNDSIYWSARRISASFSLSEGMPVKGRFGGKGEIGVGNFAFVGEEAEPSDFVWKKIGERLIKEKLI